MAGRPRKPTELLVLAGGLRKGRHGTAGQDRAAAPQPAAGCEMPAYLKAKVPALKRARELWAEEAPELERLGLLTKVDGRTFARLCVLWSWEEEAAQQKRAPLATALLAEIRQLEERFGMNPSARTKVRGTGAAGKPANPLDRWRNRA